MSVFVSHPNGYGGIADGAKSQVNNFNQLFRAIEYEINKKRIIVENTKTKLIYG